jgi:hypothetical protein
MGQLLLGIVVGAVLMTWTEVCLRALILARVAFVKTCERIPVVRFFTYRGSGFERRDAERNGFVIVS